MADVVQIRRDTAANWTSANPTLANGEQGYETDTSKMKVGDGATAWTSLSYFAGSAGSSTWIELTDTDPTTFAGQSGKYVKVNAGADGLDFGTPSGSGQEIVTSTLIVAATVVNDCKDPLRADSQCNGTADQAEINTAIGALPT